MTTTDTTTHTPDPGADRSGALPAGHEWEEAGEAWGHQARDWACLFEHYAVDVIHAILTKLDVGPGTDLLDLACGSGLAIRLAAGTGARTAGIDAAANLVAIARDRTPDADIRLGSMFELPWASSSFDTVTSINGVWGGCEAALLEARRVLRPGGTIAISFWGHGHLDLKPCFRAFAEHSPPSHVKGMKQTNGIGRPGVAEAMLTDTGFELIERDGRTSTLEWPDADTAWRAMASIGPAVPALRHVGPEVLRPIVMTALDHLQDGSGVYRMRNDQQFVLARKPA